MPFLWKFKSKLSTIQVSPSPKCKLSNPFISFIKRASALISNRHFLSASMTVEAAIVLPLFLFFFMNLGCAMEMIRLHGNLQLALWDVGNRICIYGYMAQEEEDSCSRDTDLNSTTELQDIAFTYTYVKNQVIQYVGESYLEDSPICYGTYGLQFLESDVSESVLPESDGTIDILMTYQVSPWMQIPFVRPFQMSNRYYGRLWTGYNLAGEEDYVFVTDTGRAYHESLECTHLKLSIKAIPYDAVANAVNEAGRHYSICAKCRQKPFHEVVYICNEGEFFHHIKDCPALKRTIHTITRQKALEEDYYPCSRCAGK